jgi:VWFA-related protein
VRLGPPESWLAGMGLLWWGTTSWRLLEAQERRHAMHRMQVSGRCRVRSTARGLRWTALGAAALLLGGLATARTAAAQDSPQQPPRFGEKIEVREVLLDALVTDAKGNVIVGLGKDDFVVRENGKAVDLTGVTFYSNRRLLQGSDVLAKKGIRIEQIPEDRYFILFIEDQKARSVDAPVLLTQQIEAGRRAKEWVSSQLLANDWVAVVSYDLKLKVHQDFTHDRRLLAAAIDDAVKGKEAETNWPSRIAAQPGGPSLLAGLPRGNELRDRTGTIYEGLQQLARAAGNIPARKNLVLFTNGFGRINPFGQYQPDPHYYPPTVQALNTNDVAVYSVDLWPPGTGNHTMSDSLNQLATETGGRYLFNFTNYLTALEQISKENNGYYLLSYRGEHPVGTSGYQKVEVKTVNPELRVKAREGYAWGPG